MEVKAKNGMSVVAQLMDRINKTLPKASDTRIVNHLCQVRPANKGKAIHFVWQKRDFVLTANMKVREYLFGFSAPKLTGTNEITSDIEKRITA